MTSKKQSKKDTKAKKKWVLPPHPNGSIPCPNCLFYGLPSELDEHLIECRKLTKAQIKLKQAGKPYL